MLQLFSKALLKKLGWQLDLPFPDMQKCVIIGAPHTSNWDFPLTILTMWATQYYFNWVAKESLFRKPFATIMIKLGGVPVNRDSTKGFISSINKAYKERDCFVLAIAPEGTRSRVPYWKSGFYRIAESAEVPVAFGYINYETKHIGIAEGFIPSGNRKKDMLIIQQFYADIKGKIPEKQGPIMFRDMD